MASWSKDVPLELAGHAAVAEDVDAVADGQQLRHLARDEQEGGALLGQLADQLVDLGLGPDVDAARRLVEEEEDDARQQELADHDLLLVAAAEVRDHGVDRRAS